MLGDRLKTKETFKTRCLAKPATADQHSLEEVDRGRLHAQEQKMTPERRYCANAIWAPRDQPPADISERWLRMVRGLQVLDPVFAQWFMIDYDDKASLLALDPAAITNAVAAGVGRDNEGNDEPLYGYTLNAFNEPTYPVGPRGFQLRTHADTNWKHAQNCVSLAPSYEAVPDTDVVRFDVFRGVVLALGEAFEATTAKAWQSKLADLWVSGRASVDLPIAWISYIGPPYAHLVTPPPSAIVERRPDGGLLMAATDEPFTVDTPAHMAVAREIAAAVAPFNALPRPLGTGWFD